MEIKTLNVGCGSDPWGDVRVDVAFSFITSSFKPTLLADAQYLPFRKARFEIVKASHVLEHLKNPLKALDEISRVAAKQIILSFPTELDVLPWFISNVFPPSFSALRWTYQTRKKGLHQWIIEPRYVINFIKSRGWEITSFEKGTLSFFAFFESGRKARYFKWLTKRFRVPCEYIISAEKRNFDD